LEVELLVVSCLLIAKTKNQGKNMLNKLLATKTGTSRDRSLTGDVLPGRSFPLGATVYADGVNFSIFSRAEALELLLFDYPEAPRPSRIIALDPKMHCSCYYWHVFILGIRAGQVYAYRAHGEYAPEKGLRFDSTKVLLDPYANAQERSLLPQVLATVKSDDVSIADRNFCTLNFLSGIIEKQAYFIIREHKCLPWHSIEEFRPLGSIEGEEVFEQSVVVSDHEGERTQIRRIKVVLEETTRDGDSEIFILTNLSPTVATAFTIAQIYRRRWTIETLFQVLTDIFNCEIKTLGYPQAALFAFCVALLSYNILSVVLAALRSVHGIERIEQEVSSYYLAD
jgi:hypothetical protein